MTRLLLRTLAAAALLGLTAPVAAAHGEPAHDANRGQLAGRVGVLLADHGEPPVYDANTYESFREFFAHLIHMGVIPAWLGALDRGTVLVDADCPLCTEPSTEPRLLDAWLRPHEGPAAFVPASDSLPAHYVIPAGPGLREPDIYEHVGIQAWDEWRRMGGRSPNYDEKLAKKREVVRRLREQYGDRVAIEIGYGIDPRIGGSRQGIREALDALVRRHRVDSILVAYHGVGFSDIMQTHHLRMLVSTHLDQLGAGKMPLRFSAPMGTTDAYVQAAVAKVREEVARVPATAAVAIHLSGHGLPTAACGDYNCGADAYHRSSRELFARVKPAVEAALRGRPGRFGVFHLYGDGADPENDPGGKVDSPSEALTKRKKEGFTHVIDVPYEFDSNSRDTLIVLRQGYGRVSPDWGPGWRSQYVHEGMQVVLASASGSEPLKTAAYLRVIEDALPR